MILCMITLKILTRTVSVLPPPKPTATFLRQHHNSSRSMAPETVAPAKAHTAPPHPGPRSAQDTFAPRVCCLPPVLCRPCDVKGVRRRFDPGSEIRAAIRVDSGSAARPPSRVEEQI